MRTLANGVPCADSSGLQSGACNLLAKFNGRKAVLRASTHLPCHLADTCTARASMIHPEAIAATVQLQEHDYNFGGLESQVEMVMYNGMIEW